MRRWLLSASLVGAVLVPTAAQAAIITVDPDAFAAGTNISNSFAGVTLSAIGQPDTNVYAVSNPTLSSTGNNIFGNAQNGIEWGNGFNPGMRVDFATPTTFVSIDIIGNDGSDSGRLLAYDSLNVLLGTYTTGGLGFGQFETASFSSAGGNIAYVIATGSANGFDSVSLDNLQYAAAEPATLLLLSTAFIGASVRRYRRRA